jgi:hypothetical protein
MGGEDSSWAGRQQELKVTRPPGRVKTLLRKCRCCKTGTLVTIEIFGKRGQNETLVIVCSFSIISCCIITFAIAFELNAFLSCSSSP